MTSIRGKIRLAYSSLAFIVLLLCGIAVFDLLFLEKQVLEGVAVSRLHNAVLEMRRYEKNLFLYVDSSAWSDADHYAEVALSTLAVEKAAIEEIAAPTEMTTLVQQLTAYRHQLSAWSPETVSESHLEATIRRLGHDISSLTEALHGAERQSLADAIRWSRGWLLVSIAAIAVLVYLIGRRLARVVIAPLRQFESHLMPIAQGQYDRLESNSTDAEFIAFVDAFNRMLKELQLRQRRLRQSEKLASLGTLAAGVAHEINNPLANISSSCQLLLEEIETEDHQQQITWLQQIDHETERAKRIVQALLEYGHQGHLKLTAISLNDVIEKTRLLVDSTLRKNHVRLHVDIADQLILLADPQRLQQVFINLLQNAVDAGGKGVDIWISASRCITSLQSIPEEAELVGAVDQQGAHNMIEIRIEDNGPGITEQNLPHVFEPFYTTREPGHGMGLGLYVIQEIVTEHQGTVAVMARKGQGACFILRLPCEEPVNE